LQWLGLEGLPDADKDPALYPSFNADLAGSMQRDTAQFASYVMLSGDGRLETLLTAPFAFPDAKLRPLYGLAAGNSDPNTPTPLDPS